MINKKMKKRGGRIILAFSILFLSLLYFPLTSADSGDSCGECGKGLFNFCMQNKCEIIPGCFFVENKFFKNLGSCVQTQFSPSGMIMRTVSKNVVGVDCPLNVTLNVDTAGIYKFYVIEESLPKLSSGVNGWSVSDAGTDGHTETPGKVKWVKYSQDILPIALPPAVYTYQIIPSSVASGVNTFIAGDSIYTMGDKLTENITGNSQVEVMGVYCGDNCLGPGEACDDGNTISGDGCDSLCQSELPPPECGNGGIPETGEQCDDGNTNNNDACTNQCLNNVCGDGFQYIGVEQCDDFNLINGDGCSSTCQIELYYRVFVTNQTWNGNLGGLFGADNKCQQIAISRNLGGIWNAWLSDSNKSAGARLNHATKAYRTLDGKIVANNWNDLVDGSLDSPINVNEYGNVYGIATEVWTGTQADGSSASWSNCNNWTSTLSTVGGYRGVANSTDDHWTYGNSPCNNPNGHLYCFEQSYCGNNFLEPGEICDDGNTQNGDRCSANCKCSDTESGLNTGVKGTITIFGNPPTSYTDVCVNQGTVGESYCNDNGALGQQQLNCPSGTSCYDGRCSGGGSGTGTCFLPDTLITTKDGEKMIKDVKEGDYVMSYNEKNDKYEYNKVTKTFEHNTNGYLIINNKLKITPNHPMHINGKWEEIGNAKVGDKIKTINGEETIFSIKQVNENVEVYNLEVEGSHNYIAEGYLAHNKKTNIPNLIE